MTWTILGTLTGALLGWLMGFLSLFLILLILIQRGKGGGLTGALGGPGGQSAFGSKAGDTFTFITIVVASVWGLTCAFTMWLLGTHTPTPVTKANVQAGPGDEGAETNANDLIVPPTGTSGLEGLELPNVTDEPSSTGTPSVELTPADGSATSSETPSSETPAETASEASEESTTAPDSSEDGGTSTEAAEDPSTSEANAASGAVPDNS